MSKDPAVLFYTSDFLSGTAFFTKKQRGEYITLLCEQHQLWSIPEEHMVEICGSMESPVAKKFIPDEDGNYYNVRMREETVKRRSFCESRRESVQKRYVRSTHVDTHVEHTKVRMEDGNENENRDMGIDIKTKEIGKEVPLVVWSEYSAEFRLSQYLWKRIRENGTTQKEPDHQKWSDSFDKIHRIDKHPYGWIQEIIRNVMDDNFWKQNIHSPEKLRQKINEGKLDRFIPDEYDSDEQVLERLKVKQMEAGK